MSACCQRRVAVIVNGVRQEHDVEPRLTLADFLREERGLTGTHVGCEDGFCGACTVHVDGVSLRSCLFYAVQADGREIRTVESLASPDGTLHPLQESFRRHHGLQCGFCTPGMLMTALEYLRDRPPSAATPSEQEVREALAGNLCRCTGYQGIVNAVRAVARDRSPTD